MKYEFTGETLKHCGRTLRRIRRLSDGELGGWIEKEENLSQEGGSWVDDEAKVYENAQVYGDAQVYENAQVYGDARVFGEAWVFGHARVFGDAVVEEDALVFRDAQVYGHTWVHGHAWVHRGARLHGNARITGPIYTGEGMKYREHDNIWYVLDCSVELPEGRPCSWVHENVLWVRSGTKGSIYRETDPGLLRLVKAVKPDWDGEESWEGYQLKDGALLSLDTEASLKEVAACI